MTMDESLRSSWEAVQQIDLLAAAWQLTEAEMEQVLRVNPGTLRRWRGSLPSASWSEERAEQLRELQSLQYAIWLRQPPGRYAAFWRRPWTNASPIGMRSPLAAVLADGRSAVLILTSYLIAG